MPWLVCHFSITPSMPSLKGSNKYGREIKNGLKKRLLLVIIYGKPYQELNYNYSKEPFWSICNRRHHYKVADGHFNVCIYVESRCAMWHYVMWHYAKACDTILLSPNNCCHSRAATNMGGNKKTVLRKKTFAAHNLWATLPWIEL